MQNTLYYGDNLDVMRRHIKDESVDLVYLDPPFNSNQDYNVLFKGKDGTDAAAQIKAFGDTWTWDRNTRLQYEALSEAGGAVGQLMDAFLKFLNTSDMMAYLTMMAPRLVELRRVMKPTASIYLHCDPTASHYLKLLMDAVFGPEYFRNEIVWRRSFSHNDSSRYGANHDILLFYSKGKKWTWNPQYTAHRQEYIERDYRFAEGPAGEVKTVPKGEEPPAGWRRFRVSDLTANKPGGDVSYEWKGVPPYKGRFWAYSRENMEEFESQGRLMYRETGMPVYKRYLDEMPGVPLQTFWDDVPHIISGSKEGLGYPTQKPEALLERILLSSSDEGQVVLDPFCGCGTAIAVAERLNRKWIGIDITHLAISLMKHRLTGFGEPDYAVIGEPTTMEEAVVLASEDPYQFQWWALGLAGARPVEEKKGADKGIDGRKRFFEHGKSGSKAREIIFSVKAGQSIPANAVRDLRGTMEREKADFGVLISLAKATKNMEGDADAAGSIAMGAYEGERKYPRLQCITVGELLEGKDLDLPAYAFAGGDQTLKAAPRRIVESAKKGPKQRSLL